MTSKTTENMDNMCPVCNDSIDIYAIGDCDHPICYKCSTRMRVLCEQMYCAICRTALPKVIFTRKLHKFGAIQTHHFPVNRKNKIFFEDGKLLEKFNDLLRHVCTICPEKSFTQFSSFKDHMRREHQVFNCDLCEKHIKVFSFERKFYDRKSLAEHRRVGDKDDRSHKGHPNCQFCDVRYFDRDELVRHLRKDHFYCHFCEADGIGNEYYPEYCDLADHFRVEHYMCEEGDCEKERFTNAFRTDIDLKSHRATHHGKNFNKAMAKAARTLDVDVNLAPRPGRGRGRYSGRPRREDIEMRSTPTDDSGTSFSKNAQRNASQRKRDEDEIQQAVTLTLNNEMQRQGHISVVDKALLQPQQLLSDDQSENRKSQGNSRVRKESYRENVEDFPNLDGNISAKKQPVGDGDSDHVPKTAYERDTIAKQIARSNNISVQDGPLDDFPTLNGASNSQSTGQTRGAWKFREDQDFPSLNAGGKSTKSARPQQRVMASASWTSSSSKPQATSAQPYAKQTVTHVNIPAVDSVNDFPVLKSLSSISSLLMNPRPAPAANKKSQPPAFQKYTPPNPITEPSSENVRNDIAPMPDWQRAKIDEGAASSNSKKAKSKSQDVKEKKDKNANASKNSKPSNQIVEDFPSLGKSKQPAAKGVIVAAIPACERKAPSPPVHSGSNQSPRELEWQQVPVSGGKSKEQDSKAGGMQEPPREKKAKKKKASPPDVTKKDQDFPTLEGSKAAPPPAAPVGNTWVSEEVKKTMKEGDEWKEVPSGKSAPVTSKKGFQTSMKGGRIKQNVVAIDDEDFPTLGKPKVAITATVPNWGAKNSKVNTKQPSQQQGNEDDGLVKLKNKNKKKGKNNGLSSNSPSLSSDESKTDVESNAMINKLLDKNDTAEAIIKEIQRIEKENKSGTNKENTNSDRLSDFPSANSEPLLVSPAVPVSDDFPTLGSYNKIKAPPPGFTNKSVPPPGLKKPPPGLQSSNSIPAKAPPGFTSVPEVAMPNVQVHKYSKPPNFTDRNKKLIEDIQQSFQDDETKFSIFKILSGEFRQSQIPGSAYFNQCSDMMGVNKFQEIFPELLVLLPDISKQQELLAAHQDSVKREELSLKNILRIKDSAPAPWISASKFTTCNICRQVLSNADASEHAAEHDIITHSDFPTLSQTSSKELFNFGGWGK